MKTILAILIGVSCVLTANAGNDYDSTNRLTAVWEGNSYVLATTAYGLFRASLAEKKWTRLTPPASMPLQGSFGRVPRTVDHVLFVTSETDSNKMSGIYISHDNGSSWSLVSKDYQFISAYVNDDGRLYALALKPGTWSPGANQVLMSTNQGKTWRDISEGIRGLDIFGIIPDPDHTNLVCLLGNGIRGYVLQANDEKYEWDWTAEFVWKQDQPNDERFFRAGYGTQATLYMHFATLENYFSYDFGDSVQIPAFRLLTEKKAYNFKKDEPKRINIKVVLYPDYLKVNLVDFARGLDTWNGRIKTPDTNYINFARRSIQSGNEPPKRSDVKVVELTANKPYERTIDLGKLVEFKQTGKYVVQLLYDSIGIANRDRGEWPGEFTSQSFEVVIE